MKPNKHRTPCRHCGHPRSNPLSKRGLCWCCYHTPSVRALYPSTSKFAKHGVGNHCRQSVMPSPTNAPPASPEKVAVLEGRAERGESLFSPHDADWEAWGDRYIMEASNGAHAG